MGVSGVLDRYRQIQPRVLIAESCQRYAGKHIDLMPKWSEVVKELSKYGLETVVFVSGVGESDRKFNIPKRSSAYLSYNFITDSRFLKHVV